jgi:hypothetical protein
MILQRYKVGGESSNITVVNPKISTGHLNNDKENLTIITNTQKHRKQITDKHSQRLAQKGKIGLRLYNHSVYSRQKKLKLKSVT